MKLGNSVNKLTASLTHLSLFLSFFSTPYVSLSLSISFTPSVHMIPSLPPSFSLVTFAEIFLTFSKLYLGLAFRF